MNSNNSFAISMASLTVAISLFALSYRLKDIATEIRLVRIDVASIADASWTGRCPDAPRATEEKP